MTKKKVSLTKIPKVFCSRRFSGSIYLKGVELVTDLYGDSLESFIQRQSQNSFYTQKVMLPLETFIRNEREKSVNVNVKSFVNNVETFTDYLNHLNVLSFEKRYLIMPFTGNGEFNFGKMIFEIYDTLQISRQEKVSEVFHNMRLSNNQKVEVAHSYIKHVQEIVSVLPPIRSRMMCYVEEQYEEYWRCSICLDIEKCIGVVSIPAGYRVIFSFEPTNIFVFIRKSDFDAKVKRDTLLTDFNRLRIHKDLLNLTCKREFQTANHIIRAKKSLPIEYSILTKRFFLFEFKNYSWNSELKKLFTKDEICTIYDYYDGVNMKNYEIKHGCVENIDNILNNYTWLIDQAKYISELSVESKISIYSKETRRDILIDSPQLIYPLKVYSNPLFPSIVTVIPNENRNFITPSILLPGRKCLCIFYASVVPHDMEILLEDITL
jgi:hypothetical protein